MFFGNEARKYKEEADLLLKHLGKVLPGLLERVIQLDMPVIGISSSGIRQRIAQGLPIRYLVPSVVETYIREQRIYRVPAS